MGDGRFGKKDLDGREIALSIAYLLIKKGIFTHDEFDHQIMESVKVKNLLWENGFYGEGDESEN